MSAPVASPRAARISEAIRAAIREKTSGMPPEMAAEVVARAVEARRRREEAKRIRRQLLTDHPTPLDLACRYDRTIVRTPALNLLSQRLADTWRSRDGRLVISIAPQQGKSTLLRWSIVWALIDNPDRRIVFASYAAALARTSGRIVRGLIETHGHEFGLAIDRSHADASDWQLEGHRGGMFSTGRGAMTGRPADGLVMDDVLKDQAEADSPTILSGVHTWWETVPRTRLAPGAPAINCATRWTEKDLSGRFIEEGWPLLNIPALADGQTEDALGRPAGEWLTSARGTTPEDWENTRKDVGERAWASLFQGRPAPLEGGVFQRAWFDTWRVDELPAGCEPPTVIVDPADNPGDGDEAGLIVATSHPATGKVYICDDLSAPMTVARWARLALLTCARRSAPTLAYERSLSQLEKRIREAWKLLREQAAVLRATGGDIEVACDRLARRVDGPEVRDQHREQLGEIADDVDDILAFSSAGPRLKAITPRGTKTLRMKLIAPMFETGRAVMVGRHAQVEWQLTTWQVGQDSPDRADTVVHAAALLGNVTGAAGIGRANDRVPTNSTGSRNSGSSRITRSTRR